MNAARKLDQLVAETERLLDSLADERGPKIDAVRERLLDSLERTKRAIAGRGRGANQEGDDDAEQEGDDDAEDEDETSIGVRDLAGSLNDYVRRHPWLALATGVLVAASAGILATSATRRSFRRGA